MTKDFRSDINARCVACGAHASEVEWARLGSGYENGHVIPGSVPDVCGPMVLSSDYDTYMAGEAETNRIIERNLDAEHRLTALIDQARPAVPS